MSNSNGQAISDKSSKTTLSDKENGLDFKYEILSENHRNYDLSFKIIVIGDCGVGKSCLTINAVRNIFDESYNSTVGFEFFTFNVKINDKVIKLQIWDTCGQELYRSLITNFYRNSSLAIMVYSINSKETFDNIEMWLKELRTHSNPDAKVFLIGNKIDLENERQVTKQMGEKFCKENKLSLFLESSAKTGLNAQNIFIKAAKILFDEYNNYQKIEDTGEKKNNSQQERPHQRINNKKIDNKPRKNHGGCC